MTTGPDVTFWRLLARLTDWTRIGAYAAGAWLLGVAVNLAAAGYLDMAVRDVVMAIAAFDRCARFQAIFVGMLRRSALGRTHRQR